MTETEIGLTPEEIEALDSVKRALEEVHWCAINLRTPSKTAEAWAQLEAAVASATPFRVAYDFGKSVLRSQCPDCRGPVFLTGTRALDSNSWRYDYTCRCCSREFFATEALGA